MSKSQGYVDINQARLYYEIAGKGTPLVFIHAGITDSQQWTHEFTHFSQDYQVVRYDLRGYGKSDKVKGAFSHLEDLTVLIDTLDIQPPIILMGCSLGGVLCMEYAIEHPEEIKALIIVGPGLCGLELDVDEPEEFSAAKEAFEAGDLNQLAEIETQIWFDSMDHDPEHVDCSMRALLYEMQHSGKEQDGTKEGKSRTEIKESIQECLEKIHFPVLILVGAYDLSYMHATADFMTDHLQSARKEVIEGAAHLPNLDQPQLCLEAVKEFLIDLSEGSDYDQMLP